MMNHNVIGVGACWPLAIWWFSAEMRPFLAARGPTSLHSSRCGDLIVALRAVLRGGRRSDFQVVAVPSKSRSRSADLLSGRVALLTAGSTPTFPFRASTRMPKCVQRAVTGFFRGQG